MYVFYFNICNLDTSKIIWLAPGKCITPSVLVYALKNMYINCIDVCTSLEMFSVYIKLMGSLEYLEIKCELNWCNKLVNFFEVSGYRSLHMCLVRRF